MPDGLYHFAILFTIILIFVSLGAILPFVHEAFDQQVVDLNVPNVEFQTGQQLKEETQISALARVGSVLISIISMFFFTFGAIPLIIDLVVFVPLRIIFAILIFKLLRGVGG